ncbi:hypothetical protein D7Y21_23495 [Corallococcus sp. AB045]|nr:hypothetical protein D7Y21_23495 [Corallococcus sp. AB045]
MAEPEMAQACNAPMSWHGPEQSLARRLCVVGWRMAGPWMLRMDEAPLPWMGPEQRLTRGQETTGVVHG